MPELGEKLMHFANALMVEASDVFVSRANCGLAFGALNEFTFAEMSFDGAFTGFCFGISITNEHFALPVRTSSNTSSSVLCSSLCSCVYDRLTFRALHVQETVSNTECSLHPSVWRNWLL